ncbi:14 kDa phosphohistidine phosphatase [Fukomys damarensis]|nr:14 kDa phosphohistidine phosphatase [Fukomys damarensis]
MEDPRRGEGRGQALRKGSPEAPATFDPEERHRVEKLWSCSVLLHLHPPDPASLHTQRHSACGPRCAPRAPTFSSRPPLRLSWRDSGPCEGQGQGRRAGAAPGGPYHVPAAQAGLENRVLSRKSSPGLTLPPSPRTLPSTPFLALSPAAGVSFPPGTGLQNPEPRVPPAASRGQPGLVLRAAAVSTPADIYDKVSSELRKKGYDCECLGGGRISHQNQDRKIHVYGYSMGYGRAQHSVSTEKIKAKYPDYEVTWADDGY